METYQKVSLPLFLERGTRSMPLFRVKQLKVFIKPPTWNTPWSLPPFQAVMGMSAKLGLGCLHKIKSRHS